MAGYITLYFMADTFKFTQNPCGMCELLKVIDKPLFTVFGGSLKQFQRCIMTLKHNNLKLFYVVGFNPFHFIPNPDMS